MNKIRSFIVVILMLILMAYAVLAMIPAALVAWLIVTIDPKDENGEKFDFEAEIKKAIDRAKRLKGKA